MLIATKHPILSCSLDSSGAQPFASNTSSASIRVGRSTSAASFVAVASLTPSFAVKASRVAGTSCTARLLTRRARVAAGRARRLRQGQGLLSGVGEPAAFDGGHGMREVQVTRSVETHGISRGGP